MYLSISNIISSCTVCLWPQINKNLLPHPVPLIYRNRAPQSDTEEICSPLLPLVFMTGAFLQLTCTQAQTCFFVSVFLPFFLHHSLKPSSFPTAPFTFSILVIPHPKSAFVILSPSFFHFSFPTHSLFLSILPFHLLGSQSGSGGHERICVPWPL